MGPTIILDKSALQMLSIDESCWLENFFLTNITPLLYVESLADLSKPKYDHRTSEQLVSELATKTPTMSCYPNVHHKKLIFDELYGVNIRMDGRTIIAGGKSKVTEDGDTLIDFEEFPELKAMTRWQDQKFLELENEMAQNWRNSLAIQSFDQKIALVKNIIPTDKKFSDLSSIALFVKDFIYKEQKQIVYLIYELLDLSISSRELISSRWDKLNPKNIIELVPYTAYVLSIDLFFYLALHSGHISKVRRSNMIDMAYLYYLPFCNVFVSGDKLHLKTAPLFMNEEQTFVTATELKQCFKYLDEYYNKLPDDIKSQGLMRFASYPPEVDNLVTRLWDKYLTKWRIHLEEKKKKPPLSVSENNELVDKINRAKHNFILINKDLTTEEANSVMFTRKARLKKGKWKLFPPEVEEKMRHDKGNF